MNTILDNYKKGIEELKKMAEKQPAAQKEMFARLLPYMSELAEHYQSLTDNNNYESHGHEWVSKKEGINQNDRRVIVAFTSQAIKLGRSQNN